MGNYIIQCILNMPAFNVNAQTSVIARTVQCVPDTAPDTAFTLFISLETVSPRIGCKITK